MTPADTRGSAFNMYRWVVQKMTRAVLARLRRGDTRWLLALMASDVHFRFLGDHSWAADTVGKEYVRPWLQRYVETGLVLEPQDILVAGPPWRTSVCIRFTDKACDAAGNVIYENEGVLFDRMSWGRIYEHISYEDTQRTAAFDRFLGISEDGPRDEAGRYQRASTGHARAFAGGDT